MLFDTHAHVLSADRERYPLFDLARGAKPPVTPLVFTVEDLVRVMEAGGVDHACIVQRATIYGYDNRYALDAVAAYPKRFVPIVVLDAQDTASPVMLRSLASKRRLGGCASWRRSSPRKTPRGSTVRRHSRCGERRRIWGCP